MSHELIADLGKKFIVEPSGPRLTDQEKQLLSELQPAGIMLRKRNFLSDADYASWLAAYQQLIDNCREAAARQQLIFCVDHEGGRVMRFPTPITQFPYAYYWLESVAEVAQAMAVELKSLAINLNFAPVADILSNPRNPVIGQRAFAQTAAEVAKHAVLFAKTLQANGVCPCAKHFPGHGHTTTDSHFELPVLDLSLADLRARELVPFKALIDAGVPMIMTAHILYRQIDPNNCATLSALLLNNLLRNELKFAGVIVGDAMGMAAIHKSIDDKHMVAKAHNAGLDIFLITGDQVNIEHALRLKKHLQEAVNTGEISRQSLRTSIDRVDHLLHQLPQYQVSLLDETILQQHHTLAEQLNKRTLSGFELNLPGFE